MAKIYAVMGKSASGKDTIFKRLLADKSLNLKTVVPYTTRPIRQGERHGMEYFFVSEADLAKLEEQGKIIECRCYHTIHGKWYYFMADDGQIDLSQGDYLVITTLEGYKKVRNYYGKEATVPIYIQVEDGLRLERAVKREQNQSAPRYAELCRRFLADCQDFSEPSLEEAGITKRYENTELELCLSQVAADIKKGVVL